jgi:hypothetical protein
MCEAPALADALRQVTADLDGYIRRCAAELAEPLIIAAEQADTRVGEVMSEVQRRDDLIRELRRRIGVADRNQARWQEATGCRNPGEYRLREAGHGGS